MIPRKYARPIRQIALLSAALGAAALGATRTTRADTLGEGWPWHRPLAFHQAASDAPGDNIAWAEFYTNGAQRTDGADFRITSQDRTLLPLKIMQVSRDSDLVRIAFATKSDGPYDVWWGNKKAEKPPGKELEIHRGIFLEVSRNPGNARAGLNAAADGPVLASYFLNDVSLGYDPFGDDRNTILHYTGSFRLDRAIKPQFAFTVNDSAIFSIDGKEIDRQQRGGLRSQVRTPLPVDLAAGWHTLDIRQVNANQANIVMALAWQRPGERAYTTFPGTLFAAVAHATPGMLEQASGNGAAIDIAVDPTAEVFIPPAYYASRYSFEAGFPQAFRPTITWDFGDGQTATGLKKTSHIFLAPGIYPVTLKLEMGGNVLTTTTRIAVKDRLYERFPRPPEDNAKTVQSILRDYQPAKLPADQAFRGMSYFSAANQTEEHLAWGKAWLGSKETGNVGDPAAFDEIFALARLLEAKKNYKDAAEIYRLGSLKNFGLELRANLMRHGVMTLCDFAVDPDAAVNEAQAWLQKVSLANRPQIAIVQSALAYALIAKADGKKAHAAIDAAVQAGGTGAITREEAFNKQEIRQGVLTRNVENYIRTKDFDTALQLLDQWELEFPQALWEGFTRNLRVKLAVAEGHPLVAATLALSHAQSNPDGFYAAELLYRAAENFSLAGESVQAKQAMEVLKSKYPESPYARQADGSTPGNPPAN